MMEVQAVYALMIFIMFVVMLVGERFVTALVAVIDFVWGLLSE